MLTYYILNSYEHPQGWDELDEPRAYSYASEFIYDFITNEFDKWAKENTSEIYKKEANNHDNSF